MRIFLAGIMQGSHLGAVLHSQDYRSHLRRLLERYFPEAEIYDPREDNQNSLEYDDDRGRQIFMAHNRMCGEVDMLLAFVPEASMGTAIEMWEAHRHGRLVIAISPLSYNWAIRYCSHAIYADEESLATALESGEIRRLLAEIRT